MSQSLTILLLLSFVSQSFSQSEWELLKKKESILVYTKKSEDSKYKEVKIEASIQTTMTELVAALEDVDAHKDWVPHTIDSYIVEKLHEHKFYYYVSSDFPFPSNDRDLVILYERTQNPNTKVVITKSEAVPDHMETFKKFVRIPVFSSTYILEPKANGMIDIEYLLKVSPGGKIPAWLINMAITKGPIQTMESLANLLESGKYGNIDVAGVVD